MPQLVSSPLGVVMYLETEPPPLAHRPTVRDVIKGWSHKAVRRHTQWLQSIEADYLDGWGCAVTLTVRDLPDGPQALHAAFNAWLTRQRRSGRMLRYHWVIEDQRRGVPHLHVGLWFAELDDDSVMARRVVMERIVRDWLEVASAWRPARSGQCVDVIPDGGQGWAKYCAKHSARSVAHVQRAGLPDGWESSGRLWGHGGEWPTSRDSFYLDGPAYRIMRRLLRAWSYGNAHAAVTRARRALEGARTDRGRKVATHHLAGALRRLEWLRGRDAGLDEQPWMGMREWMPRGAVERALDLVVQLGGRVVYNYDLICTYDGPRVQEAEPETAEASSWYDTAVSRNYAAARAALGLAV